MPTVKIYSIKKEKNENTNHPSPPPPDIQNSVINKRLLQEALKDQQRFSIHDLTRVYAGGNIDATREQELIRAHDALVL